MPLPSRHSAKHTGEAGRWDPGSPRGARNLGRGSLYYMHMHMSHVDAGRLH